jgi:hypothetical protein
MENCLAEKLSQKLRLLEVDNYPFTKIIIWVITDNQKRLVNTPQEARWKIAW